MTTAAIIGLGQSGLRFLRALVSLSATNDALEIVGLSDKSEERLSLLKDLTVRTSPDFREILTQPVDIILVAVSEADHFTVLSHIAECATFRRIVCEKPLTATQEEAQQLTTQLGDDQLTLAFVERHSAATSRLRQHLQDHRRRIVRVHFSWGKCRLGDPRPTIGVISELSHPVDLAVHLAGVTPGTPFQVLAGASVESDFAGEAKLDSLTFAVQFQSGLLLTGQSSYVRSQRERRVELYLAGDGPEVCEVASLAFDCPLWDDDSLTIRSLRGDGDLILDYRTPLAGAPPSLRTIEKVTEFIRLNIADLHGERSESLARFDQAAYVQSLVGAILDCAREHQASFRGFGSAGLRGLRDGARGKIDLIRRTAQHLPVDQAAYVWDEGY